MVSKATETIIKVFQDIKHFMTCLTTDTVALPSFCKAAFDALRRLISSTIIGMLFEMARKKVFAFNARAGSSLVNWLIELPRPSQDFL